MADSPTQSELAALRKIEPFKDSYAPLVIELSYRPTASADLQTLDARHSFISLHLSMKATETWMASLTLLDPKEEFLIGGMTPGVGAEFVIRWNWDVPNALDRAPYCRGKILKAMPEYRYGATQMTFELTDNRVLDDSIDKLRKPRAFKPGMLASEIFDQIAKACNWYDKGVGYVEDSLGKLGGFILRADETHTNFIRDRLLPRTYNDRNEPFMFSFDPDGIVHFHSRSYKVGDTPGRPKTPRPYTYARDRSGEVLDFAPEDNTLFCYIAGGGDGTMGGIDSKGGVPIERKTDAAGGVYNRDQTEVARTPPTAPDEVVVPNLRRNSDGSDLDHVPDNAFTALETRDLDDAIRKTAARYGRMREQMFKAKATVKGTHDLRPMGLVKVDYYTTQGDKHYLSGVFTLVTVEHDVDSSGWRTELPDMQRGGVSSIPGEESLTIKSKGTVVATSD